MTEYRPAGDPDVVVLRRMRERLMALRDDYRDPRLGLIWAESVADNLDAILDDRDPL